MGLESIDPGSMFVYFLPLSYIERTTDGLKQTQNGIISRVVCPIRVIIYPTRDEVMATSHLLKNSWMDVV